MSTLDQHGNPFSGGQDAVAEYDESIHALLRYGPSILEHAAPADQGAPRRSDGPGPHGLPVAVEHRLPRRRERARTAGKPWAGFR